MLQVMARQAVKPQVSGPSGGTRSRMAARR